MTALGSSTLPDAKINRGRCTVQISYVCTRRCYDVVNNVSGIIDGFEYNIFIVTGCNANRV